MNKIDELCAFLDESKSRFHAGAAIVRRLADQGYTRLAENRPWELTPGGKYYLTRNDTAVLVFRIPTQAPTGFMLSASHLDRPTFLVKENGELTGDYTRLATEIYGGMLIHPWLDRPLSIAGRVLVETETGIESRLVDIDRDLCMIPNLAIHQNRTANDGVKWNPAVDTLPLLGSKDAAGKLDQLLEEIAGGKILSRDLYLYVRDKARLWGIDNEYLCSAALDDLMCVWGCMEGFLAAKDTTAIPVLCVLDSEEVGSSSIQGADSTLLSGTLSRITRSLSLDEDILLANSFMVSADNAQALHPNHPELGDKTSPAFPGGGVVIKFNANQAYTSDGLSAAIFRRICADAQVPTQIFYNRADLRSGSTLGRISLNHVSIPSVDIGLAQFAMHSCYESAGARDPIHLLNAMTAYYGTALTATESGYTIH